MAYPSDTELTQVATLKAWIGILPSDTTADSVLQLLINRLSSAMGKELNRDTVVLASGVIETHDGNGKDRLLLRTTPVKTVTSVVASSVSIPLSTDPTIPGFMWDERILYLVGGYRFASGLRNVTVTLDGGFEPASTELLAIEHAVLIACAAHWKRRKDVGKSSEQMSGIGGMSFSPKTWPSEAREIIESFKRRTPK